MRCSAFFIGICAVLSTLTSCGPSAAQQQHDPEKAPNAPDPATMQDMQRVTEAMMDSVKLFSVEYDSLMLELNVARSMLAMAEFEAGQAARQDEPAKIEEKKAAVRKYQERIARLEAELAPFDARLRAYQERLQRMVPAAGSRPAPR